MIDSPATSAGERRPMSRSGADTTMRFAIWKDPGAPMLRGREERWQFLARHAPVPLLIVP
jgi:hypothetical protein